VIDAFLATLREGLQAFLAVAATLAFLRKSGSRRLVLAIQWGIALSVVLSVVAAWIMAGAFNQELWEGLLALVAAASVVAVISYVWRTARVARDQAAGTLLEPVHGGAMWLALLLFTVIVLARHGMETALLMGTLMFQVRAIDITVAAAAGTLASAGAAWVWASHGHRLRQAIFMPLTVLMLSVIALGLVRFGVQALSVAAADVPGVR
jgi:high-affinity iron transporter